MQQGGRGAGPEPLKGWKGLLGKQPLRVSMVEAIYWLGAAGVVSPVSSLCIIQQALRVGDQERVLTGSTSPPATAACMHA